MQILFLLFFSTTIFCKTLDIKEEKKYQEIVNELGLGVKFEIEKHSTTMPEDYKRYVKDTPIFKGNISIHYLLTKDLTTIIEKHENLLPDDKIDKEGLLSYFKSPPYENEIRYEKTYSNFIPTKSKGFYEIYSFKSKQLAFSEKQEDIYTIFAVIKGRTDIELGTVKENQKAKKTFKSYVFFKNVYEYSIADAVIEAAEAFTYNELSKIVKANSK